MAFKIFFGNPSLAPPTIIAGVVDASEAADTAVLGGQATGLAGALAASEAADTAAVSGRSPSTLNPSDKSTSLTLSNGNLTATKTFGVASYAMVRSTDSYATGKRYCEAWFDGLHATSTDDVGIIGLATSTSNLDTYLGAQTDPNFSAGLYPDGTVWQDATGAGFPTGKVASFGERVGLAIDYDAGQAWVRDSTGWYGDPTTGVGNVISFIPNLRLHIATHLWSTSTPGGPDRVTVNFGATAFAYAIPAGFEAWEAGAPAAATGTLAASEAADVAAVTGTVLSGVGGVLAASEAADDATMAGSATGYAGTLATSEAPDTAAISAKSEWFGTLAATESPNTAAFTAAAHWLAILATSEAADSASFGSPSVLTGTLAATEGPDDATMSGLVRWLGTLQTNEGADAGAFVCTVAWQAVLAAVDGPDTASGAGTVGWQVALAASEAPDTAVIEGDAVTGAALAVSEAPDTAAFTSAPVSIQEAEGHILRSAIPRARALQNGSLRIRTLKYPVPRPRDLRNGYGPRVRDLDGRRVRTLEEA